jgi:DNA-binding winged helix-turn-helix (wHTH) protein
MIFTFGEYSVDSDRRELRRGTELVAVEPQVFDVLLHLIKDRDRVVSRDDLLASVWGGRIVSGGATSPGLWTRTQLAGVRPAGFRPCRQDP